MMDKLNSKRIIITGGSLGIGFAIAKACAGQGAGSTPAHTEASAL